MKKKSVFQSESGREVNHQRPHIVTGTERDKIIARYKEVLQKVRRFLAKLKRSSKNSSEP